MQEVNVDQKATEGAIPVPRLLEARRLLSTVWPRFLVSVAIACLLIFVAAGHRTIAWLGEKETPDLQFAPFFAKDPKLAKPRPFDSKQAGELGGGTQETPWEGITPSKKLEWHPCYEKIEGGYQCAILTVPLDYEQYTDLGSPSNGAEAHIALLLYPAKNTTHAYGSSPSKRSPMLINPGGPGGSGTALGLSIGPPLQFIIGEDQPILGFDPRGIGFSTPRADCFAPLIDGTDGEEDARTGFYHRMQWEKSKTFIGLVNSSSVATKYLDTTFRASNRLCKKKHEELGARSILAHSSTAHVARDMISIIDAWDEWQDSLKDLTTEPQGPEEIDETDPTSTKGKLVYWGFSYGTYLGNVFASMFPDRVGRLILDGVVDADRYVEPVWMDSLHDTDKILDLFFEYCAGRRQACQFFREGDEFEDVANRYAQVIARLQDQPMTVISPPHHAPIVISATYVKQIVFSILYSPSAGFPFLETFLDDLFREDTEKLGQAFLQPDLADYCALSNLVPVGAFAGDAQKAIMCGDKTELVDLDLAEIQEIFDTVSKTSSFADVWLQLLLPCNGWDINAGVQPPRPSAHQCIDATTQINTSYPILFLSNTLDPVTPLLAGVKMALKFKDAGLIEQQSAGHCTLVAVSPCTLNVVREYILEGKVPPPPKVDGDDYLGGTWQSCGVPNQEFGVQEYQSASTIFEGSFRIETTDSEETKEKKRLAALAVIRDALMTFSKWGGMVAWETASDEPLNFKYTIRPNWL